MILYHYTEFNNGLDDVNTLGGACSGRLKTMQKKFSGWQNETMKLADGGSVVAVCPVILSVSRATDIPAFFVK